MHKNSRLLFEEYVLGLIKSGMRVLEIGPDGFPSTYQSVSPSTAWDTIDIYGDNRLTYTARSEYSFPIEDNVYDLVVSGQVVEHVRKIWIWMREVARVTKPGGQIVTISPISWPYHEAPIDCWRIYPEGMKALYDDAGIDMTFSYWGSLEPVSSKRRIGGRSREQQSVLLRTAYRMLSPFGFHEECSFDAIAIGTKR